VADDGGDNTTVHESDSGGGSDGGTDSAVTDSSGTNSSGTDSGVTNSSGTDAGGTNSSGTDAGGTNSSGTDAGGTNSSGTDAGGTNASGTDSGGINSSGIDSGGADSGVTNSSGTDSGGTDPGGDGRTDSGGNKVTPFGYTVSPTTVSPGGTVTLKATGCETPTVRVTGPVFDAVTLNAGRSGKAKVSPDAKPGAQYDVTFDCKGQRGTAKLKISAGGARPTTPTTPTVPRGVEAGDGGSLSKLDVTQLLAGTALVAGAVGAGGVYAVRRRSGSQD
jgi:hypothetical protein